MPYLNLDLDYFEHPKTRRLVGLLGRGSEAFPLRLWCYCGKYHPGDGRLSDYSVQEIESVLCWYGQPGQLIEAMVKVGFIHKDSKGYYVHDWLTHSGHLSAFKERATKGAKARWEKIRNKQSSVDDASSNTCDASSNASSNTPTNQPNQPNLLNQTNQTKDALVDSGGLDFVSGFGLDARLFKLGLRRDILSKYRQEDIVEVLSLYDSKVNTGQSFRNPGGWIVTELKKRDAGGVSEKDIADMIENVKASEAYARGNCPPSGKTIRQYAIEKLKKKRGLI